MEKYGKIILEDDPFSLSPRIRKADKLKFAVIGSPVAHSLSPKIHYCFAKQFNLDIDYEQIETPLESLNATIANLNLKKYIGVNVTSPLKQELFFNIDRVSDRAKHAMAVNTISFLEQGGIWGDNTDGIGFIRDLVTVNAVQLANTKVLVLGAGGAARGILRPMLSFGPKMVMVCNRDVDKAHEIAKYFKKWGRVEYCDYKSLKDKKYDLIVNATSAGMRGEAPELPSKLTVENSICYDLNYGEVAKPFIRMVKSKGAKMVLDGSGMLVQQAAESFYVWHHVRVDVGLGCWCLEGADLM